MHESGVMLPPLTSGHLSVYYDGIISSDLGCSFLLESYYHLGVSLWGASSSFEAQVAIGDKMQILDFGDTHLDSGSLDL